MNFTEYSYMMDSWLNPRKMHLIVKNHPVDIRLSHPWYNIYLPRYLVSDGFPTWGIPILWCPTLYYDTFYLASRRRHSDNEIFIILLKLFRYSYTIVCVNIIRASSHINNYYIAVSTERWIILLYSFKYYYHKIPIISLF